MTSFGPNFVVMFNKTPVDGGQTAKAAPCPDHSPRLPCTAPTALYCPTAVPPVQYTVELSLEEIYHGCLKKVVHTRKVGLSQRQLRLVNGAGVGGWAGGCCGRAGIVGGRRK